MYNTRRLAETKLRSINDRSHVVYFSGAGAELSLGALRAEVAWSVEEVADDLTTGRHGVGRISSLWKLGVRNSSVFSPSKSSSSLCYQSLAVAQHATPLEASLAMGIR
jgi:hypothetical protein